MINSMKKIPPHEWVEHDGGCRGCVVREGLQRGSSVKCPGCRAIETASASLEAD